MDVDFWAASVHRHIPSIQSSRLGSSVMEDEGGDEVRAWFPCPFCYVEIELPVFCVHLQEEHCFNLKNAVCPICAANLGRDAIGHFAAQHAHSIKRRKKSSHTSSNVMRIEFRELSSFLGGSVAAPDPLVSPFLSTMPRVDTQIDASSCVADAESKSSCPDETEAHDDEEMRQRVAFVHELVISTIF